ncbi:MAG: DUF5979 domain-containing protein, partial [Promicromonosporaceae bacterium]|nr:DUF5979 domain-containing protein [Promicromonosporaceae bacterium]
MATAHRAPRRQASHSAWRRSAGAVTALTLALGGAVLVDTWIADTAAAAQQPGYPDMENMPGWTCLTTDYCAFAVPDSGGQPLFTENGVSTWVAGDLAMTNHAVEFEGRTVVGGDFTISKSGTDVWVNLGVAGIGSQIAPAPNSVMIGVVGNMTIDRGYVSVGNNMPGRVAVGGANNFVQGSSGSPGANITFNGGAPSPLSGAELTDFLAPYRGGTASAFHQDVVDLSRSLAGRSAGNTAASAAVTTELRGDPSDPSAPSYETLVLHASSANRDADGLYVFTVTAEQLSAVRRIDVDGLATGFDPATGRFTAFDFAVINVVGGQVDHVFAEMWADGVRIAGDAVWNPDLGKLAAALMWNFADAPHVSLVSTTLENPSYQYAEGTPPEQRYADGLNFLGSILIPAGNLYTNVLSTNGRLYVGGSYQMDDLGPDDPAFAHSEHHNYPWLFSPLTSPPAGEVQLAKELDGDSLAVLPADVLAEAVSRGSVTCTSAGSGLIEFDPWDWSATPRAGPAGDPSLAQTLQGIPLGYTCTITEEPGLFFGPAHPSDGQPVPLPAGYHWAPPDIVVNGSPGPTFTLTEGAPVAAVVVTNRLVATTQVTKHVSLGEYENQGVAVDDSFALTWTATQDQQPVDGFVVVDGVTAPAAGSSTGTVQVAPGTPASPTVAGPGGSPQTLYFALGTTVTWSEAASGPTGFRWDLTLDPQSVVIGQTDASGAPAMTSALNTLVPAVTSFQVSKTVDGAAAGNVDPAATFSIPWWVNGVKQSPDLTVTRDGTPVTVEQWTDDAGQSRPLTQGDDVQLVETRPTDTAAVAWTGAAFAVDGTPAPCDPEPAASPWACAAFTLGAGPAATDVTLTNTARTPGVGLSLRKLLPPDAAFDGLRSRLFCFEVVYGNVSGAIAVPANGVPVQITAATVLFKSINYNVQPNQPVTASLQGLAAGDQIRVREVFGGGDWQSVGCHVATGSATTPNWNGPQPPTASWMTPRVMQVDGAAQQTTDGALVVTLGGAGNPALVDVSVTNSIATSFNAAKTVAPGGTSGLLVDKNGNPAAFPFTIGYEVVDGPNKGLTGTFTLNSNVTPGQPGPQLQPGIPVALGDTVRLTELEPGGPDGVAWGAPKFSIDGVTTDTFTVGLRNGNVPTVFVSVTNTATAPKATFGVSKVLDGPAAGVVPAGTELTVGYT